MIHKGGADGISGTAQQVMEFAKQYEKQINALKEYLIERGLDKKLVNNRMQGEWYVDANEAVKLGIAHSIITDIEDIV